MFSFFIKPNILCSFQHNVIQNRGQLVRSNKTSDIALDTFDLGIENIFVSSHTTVIFLPSPFSKENENTDHSVMIDQ